MHSEQDFWGKGATPGRLHVMISLKKYRKDISSEYVIENGSLGEGDLNFLHFEAGG